jgi:hypothetical protein
MDSSATKFDPQVMALAMPTDSAFTKGAEGVSNIGKVFIDAEDHQNANALNALKMEDANQSIIGKKNENSVFGENQLIKQNTYAQERAKRLAETVGLEFKNAADLKKQTENGFMEDYGKLVPSSSFNDPKTGKFSEDYYQTFRKGFIDNGDWAKDNIHLFDAQADKYRKDSLENTKTNSEINSKDATTKKTNLEALTVLQESQAKQNSWNASANSANSTATKNKVETEFIPLKSQQIDRQIAIAKQNTANGTSAEKRQRMKAGTERVVDTNFGKNIDGYSELSTDDKTRYQQNYIDTGLFTHIGYDAGEDGSKSNYRLVSAPAKVQQPVKQYKSNELPTLPKVLPKGRPPIGTFSN